MSLRQLHSQPPTSYLLQAAQDHLNYPKEVAGISGEGLRWAVTTALIETATVTF